MGITNIEYFSIFVMAYLLVGALTPLMRRIAIATDVIDRPNSSHKSHKQPVPYLGGVAIIIGVIAISYSTSLVSNFTTKTFWLATSVLGPALALGLIGLWDEFGRSITSVAIAILRINGVNAPTSKYAITKSRKYSLLVIPIYLIKLS